VQAVSCRGCRFQAAPLRVPALCDIGRGAQERFSPMFLRGCPTKNRLPFHEWAPPSCTVGAGSLPSPPFLFFFHLLPGAALDAGRSSWLRLPRQWKPTAFRLYIFPLLLERDHPPDKEADPPFFFFHGREIFPPACLIKEAIPAPPFIET